MAKDSIRHVLKRIDIDLANEIKNYADKNRMSFRRASQEIAQLTRIKLVNKKIYKEIKI